MTTTRAESEPFVPLPLIGDPGVRKHLTELDADADGRLTFTELKGRTVLTPSDESSFVFTEEDDIPRYNRLAASDSNAFVFTRFRDKVARFGALPTAEAWLADAGSSLFDAGPQYPLTWNGTPSFDLWDIMSSPAGTSLLMEYHGYLPALPGFFFTLTFPAGSGDVVAMVGDEAFSLGTPFADGREEWRSAVLEALYIAMVDYLGHGNAFFTPFQIERVEALMIHANSHLTDFYDRPKPKKEALPEELAASVALNFKGAVPERGRAGLTVNGVAYDLPVLSEAPVPAEDLALLQKALEALPPEMVFALWKNKFLDGPKRQRFQFVSPEVMRAGGYGGVSAVNQSGYHIIIFDLNTIRYFTIEELAHTLVHELAHTLLPPEKRNDSFVPAYFERLKGAFTADELNPAASPYGLSCWEDFFAESVAAYFNGETDPDPWVAVGYGPRSRAELRGKQPELYVALRLFFDADSPLFGDPYCFSREAGELLTRLVASEDGAFALDPATPAETLAGFLRPRSVARKCRATNFDQRVQDPFHGDFHHIYVYDSGIDLEGDGTDERVMIEEKLVYDTPGERWGTTIRIVVLKRGTDGRVQRLAGEVHVDGPLSVKDFLAYGVEPIFGGLYVVTAQGRDFLRVRTRLGWNADFHVFEDGGEYRLVRNVNRLP